jgi:acyl dehydratase
MAKLTINNYEEFEKYVGLELGESEFLHVTQEQINLFADATLDHQWIHIDEERAKVESPFKTTIAHGYLNLALVPYLWAQILEVQNIKLLVNYGIENLRFGQPVAVGSEVRLKAKLDSLVNLRGIAKASVRATMEIKGNKKPAFEAVLVLLYHFN